MVELAYMDKDPQGRPLLTAAELGALSRLLGEGDAAAGRRLAALVRYTGAALPDRVQHLWRFTDPHGLMPEQSVLSYAERNDMESKSTDGAAALLEGGARPRAVLSAAMTAAGVELIPLAEASAADLDLFAAMFADSHGFFTAFNEAAWNSGLLLRIPDGVRIADPIHIRVEADGGTSVPRLMVLIGAGSEAAVVEEHAGGQTGGRVVGNTEIVMGRDSRLSHAMLQLWNPGVRGHLARRARLADNAELLSVFTSLGGQRVKLELTADLAGRGARSEMIGVTLGVDGQRMDHHTGHRHLKGDTWSNIDFKAVAASGARSSYTGLIRIEEQAAGAQAFQENRNLLLDETARADSIPELEILTDDVNCSHGATVAPIDQEQLFYLQSRGLTASAAERLVVRGFLEGTLNRLPEGLRDTVSTLVDARLDSLDGGRQ